MVQIVEMNKKSSNRLTVEQYDDRVKKLRKESEKMVKGMFEFLDAQGGWLDFNYRQFKGEPILTIRLVHGEICELPMGIIKHLNNTKKKIRKFNSDSLRGTELKGEGFRGLPQSYDVVSRVRFTPMDVL